MDAFALHLQPLQRRFRRSLQVSAVGYLPRKRERVRRVFSTINFSFILRGAGTYTCGPDTWQVRAPCVITQWPGVEVDYRPTPEWEEFYITYPAADLEELITGGFADRERPWWRIHDPDPVHHYLQRLRVCLRCPDRAGMADKADWLCEGMVMQSLLAVEPVWADERERAIRSIQAYIEANPAERIDFDELALDHGMSPSSFRRHWRLCLDLPPARYQMRLRMRQACRLLVETPLAVSQVAEMLGFRDPLYFSRAFRNFAGMPATRYRREHALNLPRPSERGSG